VSDNGEVRVIGENAGIFFIIFEYICIYLNVFLCWKKTRVKCWCEGNTVTLILTRTLTEFIETINSTGLTPYQVASK